MNALTVCVGYDDLLRITLPRMAAVFEKVCVVTDKHDHDTVLVAESRDNVFAHQTDAFTRNGAELNKGLAIEEGLDMLGRQGWICCLDADILLPEEMRLEGIKPGSLYGAHRRICPDPQQRDGRWEKWPIQPDRELGGFFHLFSAEDAVLQGRRPWYATNYRHAGGCDSRFERLWPRKQKIRLPLEVLHLGPVRQHWFGRAPEAVGLMEELDQRRRQRDRRWERLPTQTTTAKET